MDNTTYNDAAKAEAEASVLAAASNLSGSMAAARRWYFHQTIAEFDGLTPSQAIAAGRSEDVMRYMELLEAVEIGWADFDAARVSVFGAADVAAIKAKGRARLASRKSL